ncbi:thioredoxin domain-containing protein [Flavobacterium piscis]|uniref:Membrane protein n=1 Tax=Flavobacterium piscis TaxID=1114874 RepID=A0ABU1Y4M8_9FLAO|nr:thioredoxin domain-containing protein [Flavobacterium piscis]MDR7209013.1 putative membrane protein [Flavobacterium piscis]
MFIEKSKFIFQFKSHPEYPSLLAITDVLAQFNVKNDAINVCFSEILLLPNYFITALKQENGVPKFCFIEKKDNEYICFADNNEFSILSQSSLEDRWTNVVLLVEKSEFDYVVKNSIKNYNWILLGFVLILFLGILYRFSSFLKINLFFVFPFVGVLLSIAALKNLFGDTGKLINNFCSVTLSSNCSSVSESNKWEVFKIINFSDLSIVLFCSQLVSLFLSILTNNIYSFLIVQIILLLISIPVMLASLYFQKFVEKKWCPICLIIISIIIMEMIFIYFAIDFNHKFSFDAFLLSAFTFVLVFSIWNQLKKILTKQKQLKEKLFKSIRFERNYGNFKNNLIANPSFRLPKTSIILGNPESKIIISIVFNLFCTHCKEAHELLESILEKHDDDLQIQVILKTNIEEESSDNKNVLRSLITIYDKKGETDFVNALKSWFEIREAKEWLSLFSVNTTSEFDVIFDTQYKWCQENNFDFTPAIFINGYEYPQTYDRDLLSYFVNDLIEDDF